jgi:predicted MFS family arabinose efflux permease
MLTAHFGWRAVFVFGAVLAGAITVTTFSVRLLASASAEPVDARPDTPAGRREPIGPVLPALIFNFLLFFNYSVFVALPLYTEHRFGASPETNARLLMVISVVHILASVPAGRAIRRWGAQRSLVAGMLLAIAGTLLAGAAPNTFVLSLPLLLYGAGQITGTNAAGDTVLHLGGQSTRAIGYLRFSSDLGLVVGPYATGTLSDHFGYGAPFLALSIVMALAALVALWMAHRAGDGVR